MIIKAVRPLEIDIAINRAQMTRSFRRTRRQRFLVEHSTQGHRLEARDNHDQCLTCGATFWRPNR